MPDEPQPTFAPIDHVFDIEKIMELVSNRRLVVVVFKAVLISKRPILEKILLDQRDGIFRREVVAERGASVV